MTDTMIKVSMFLGDNGEAELSRELFAEIERIKMAERERVRILCIEECDRHLSVLASVELRRTMISKLVNLDVTKELAKELG